MNDHLRDRILRRLEALGDDRGYQILDYVEFLESRYAEKPASGNAFTRFTEGVEDRLRAGKVSATAIAETMSLMNRAANVLGGALAAGKSVANDIVSSPRASGRPASEANSERPAAPPPTSTSPPPPPSSPGTGTGPSQAAPDVAPGSPEERL